VSTVQALAWLCGAAAAIGVFRGLAGRGRARFALGLWLGALFGHVGWALLHLGAFADRPERVLQVGAVSVLFVPLGPLCVAPWRESLAALPLGLAIARLGCLPFGCCYASVWGALPELAALVGLQGAAWRQPRLAPAIVLCGFGALRLASLPLRVPPTPAPWLDPAWIALAWIAVGARLQGRLGSAVPSREGLGERAQPLLRALAAVLGVWLLFPLAERLLGASPAALFAASCAGLALVSFACPRRARTAPRPSLARIAGGLLAGWLCAGLAAALIGWPDPGPGAPAASALAPALAAGGGDALRWLSLGLLVPMLEERLHREWLLLALRDLYGARWALLGSSALFAVGHADPAVAAWALVGGLVCGLARLGSGGLALPIALHAGWNQGVLLFGA
jgi:membrane protease YdiL (CAAX protease family)